jgi:hypothetical protein
MNFESVSVESPRLVPSQERSPRDSKRETDFGIDRREAIEPGVYDSLLKQIMIEIALEKIAGHTHERQPPSMKCACQKPPAACASTPEGSPGHIKKIMHFYPGDFDAFWRRRWQAQPPPPIDIFQNLEKPRL